MSEIKVFHTDMYIDGNICGRFFACGLCRGQVQYVQGWPKDVEKACMEHSKKYHDGNATFGWYSDGARTADV